MALIKSPVIASGSGSIAGMTLSRNRGGMYIRSRAIPTNPNTTYQQAVRNIVADLSNRWRQTLTAAQRIAWNTYADNVPLINPLGDPHNVSGLNMYIRSNVPRIQASYDRIDDGPTNYDLGSFTSPSGVATVSPSQLALTFDNTDDWANEDDAVMLCYLSGGQNPTINYFKGPYRLAGGVEGDSVTPPTSPATITAPFTWASGQKVFFKVTVTRADGRYSATFRGSDNIP